MAHPTSTTPETAIGPGGQRMHSMDEPMAPEPAAVKDTPIPTTTPHPEHTPESAAEKAPPVAEPASVKTEPLHPEPAS